MKSSNSIAVPLIMVLLAVVAIVATLRDRAASSKLVLTYTEADLQELVQPGLSPAELKSTFGPPANTMTGPDGTTFFDYLLPRNSENETNSLGGFQATFKEDKLLRWKPIYRDTPIAK